MYIIVAGYQLSGKMFDSFALAREAVELSLAEKGPGYKVGIAKLETIIATKPVEVEVAELSGEEFYRKLVAKNNKYKSLGIDPDEVDY